MKQCILQVDNFEETPSCDHMPVGPPVDGN